MPVAPFRSAAFYSTDGGATVGALLSGNYEATHPLPSGVTNIYRFDEQGVNNAGLLAQWAANSASFAMSGSQVLIAGDPAAFDPPGLVFLALQNAETLYSKAAGTSDAFTREEQAQILAIAFRAAGLFV